MSSNDDCWTLLSQELHGKAEATDKDTGLNNKSLVPSKDSSNKLDPAMAPGKEVNMEIKKEMSIQDAHGTAGESDVDSIPSEDSDAESDSESEEPEYISAMELVDVSTMKANAAQRQQLKADIANLTLERNRARQMFHDCNIVCQRLAEQNEELKQQQKKSAADLETLTTSFTRDKQEYEMKMDILTVRDQRFRQHITALNARCKRAEEAMAVLTRDHDEALRFCRESYDFIQKQTQKAADEAHRASLQAAQPARTCSGCAECRGCALCVRRRTDAPQGVASPQRQ
ncbi:hypothetical protein BP6252_09758 [Coleophoma cylindrospora]|uniref:Uncharacterized protein n=1 Tax=Coleophoma cylindrospora TaxID=1849047 RepID=A0A3D8QWB2_9HELO|nr:hypothetical protein BP6252_09758 [Coleophoma cylindrospora]